uniref:Putative secreted protein n=1 Tax=Anopheles darlingi TaxID=43151 RepID=A0A2M4DP94_ANODA
MPPFGLGLGTPALASAYGGALPNLNAFALAQNGGLGNPNPANVRGLSNVLLVSNLNDEMRSRLMLYLPSLGCMVMYNV